MQLLLDTRKAWVIYTRRNIRLYKWEVGWDDGGGLITLRGMGPVWKVRFSRVQG